MLRVPRFVHGRGRYGIRHRLLWPVVWVLPPHTHSSANFAPNCRTHSSANVSSNDHAHGRTNFAPISHSRAESVAVCRTDAAPVGRAFDSAELRADSNADGSPDAATERPSDDHADGNSDNRTIVRAHADAHDPAHYGTLPFGAHVHSIGVRVALGRVLFVERVLCGDWRSVLRRYMWHKRLRVLRAPISVYAPEPISVTAPEPAPTSRADSSSASCT